MNQKLAEQISGIQKGAAAQFEAMGVEPAVADVVFKAYAAKLYKAAQEEEKEKKSKPKSALWKLLAALGVTGAVGGAAYAYRDKWLPQVQSAFKGKAPQTDAEPVPAPSGGGFEVTPGTTSEDKAPKTLDAGEEYAANLYRKGAPSN